MAKGSVNTEGSSAAASVIEQNKGKELLLWECDKEEYKALVAAGAAQDDTVYIVKDDDDSGGGASSADKIAYDNATSGLDADTVQKALDLLADHTHSAEDIAEGILSQEHGGTGVTSLAALAAAMGAAQSISGNYVGADSNILELAFSFAPKFVIISNGSLIGIFVYGANQGIVIGPRINSNGAVQSDVIVTGTPSWGSNTFRVSNISNGLTSKPLLNGNPATTYYYVAIG